MPMRFTFQDDYTERGWEGSIDVEIDKTDADAAQVKAATYATETLGYDCGWQASGQEAIQADGQGVYTEQNDAGQCDLYRIEYQWEQKGTLFEQTVTTEQNRDSCDAEWQTVESSDYTCTLLGHFDGGFYCLYNYDGEASLMRYTRQ